MSMNNTSLNHHDIVVGESYLNLLWALDSLEPTVHGMTAQAIDHHLLEAEKEHAEELIEALKAQGYEVDDCVINPDGSVTEISRAPQIGDTVTLVSTNQFISEESCDNRIRIDDMSICNSPDTNPFTPLGWADESFDLRITLYDVIESKVPNLTKDKPYTLACLDYLAQWDTREDSHGASWSHKVRSWARRADLDPMDLLIDVAKDRRRRFRKYSEAQWILLTKNIYVIYSDRYAKISQDNSFWWVEAWEDIKQQDKNPDNISLFNVLNEESSLTKAMAKTRFKRLCKV